MLRYLSLFFLFGFLNFFLNFVKIEYLDNHDIEGFTGFDLFFLDTFPSYHTFHLIQNPAFLVVLLWLLLITGTLLSLLTVKRIRQWKLIIAWSGIMGLLFFKSVFETSGFKNFGTLVGFGSGYWLLMIDFIIIGSLPIKEKKINPINESQRKTIININIITQNATENQSTATKNK
jgi:hypothetical protein